MKPRILLTPAFVSAACGKEPRVQSTRRARWSRPRSRCSCAAGRRRVGGRGDEADGAASGSVKVEPVDFRTLRNGFRLARGMQTIPRVRGRTWWHASSKAEAVYEDGRAGESCSRSRMWARSCHRHGAGMDKRRHRQGRRLGLRRAPPSAGVRPTSAAARATGELTIVAGRFVVGSRQRSGTGRLQGSPGGADLDSSTRSLRRACGVARGPAEAVGQPWGTDTVCSPQGASTSCATPAAPCVALRGWTTFAAAGERFTVPPSRRWALLALTTSPTSNARRWPRVPACRALPGHGLSPARSGRGGSRSAPLTAAEKRRAGHAVS
jgi:hypothetical protein